MPANAPLSIDRRGMVMVEYETWDGYDGGGEKVLGFFASAEEAEMVIAGTIPADWDKVYGSPCATATSFCLTPITLGISPERMSVAYANAEVRRLRAERGLKA